MLKINLIFKQALNKADIAVEGLFMNADAGFDAQNFRKHCESKDIIANIAFNKRNGSDTDEIYFDEILYHQRYAIERTNAWLDSFRSLLNRFDTTVSSWKSFNYLAFMVIALRKFYTKKSLNDFIIIGVGFEQDGCIFKYFC
ncbi:transposase [Chryseobacterium muglaense]|uniref:Transposase n=1 Tax=Chryseobacterium muglaense TaxID=2893752 RepID=A0ABR8M6R4_9FLAO|nr:transposase [Chryseobacterium muglaense]